MKSELEGEQYIKIIPLKEVDYQKIHKKKSVNPLQKIKVSNSTPLYSLSNYIQKFTKVDQGSSSVCLYAPCSPACIQLPLSLTISEYVLITGKDEVRYSFIPKSADSAATRADAAPSGFDLERRPNRPDAKLKVGGSAITYPMPPIFQDSNASSNFVPHNEDSQIEPLFHTGFSIFSNSFGPYISNVDSNYPSTEQRETVEPISLRNGLEKLLEK